MSTTLSFDDIEGIATKEQIFKGFVVKDNLIEYDSPVLIEAKSPEGNSWLFSWCDSTDDRSTIGRWVAFKVTKHRLSALLDDRVSLREALTLPEDKFYIFDAKTLFEPIQVKITSPENLPKDYFPSEDLSIKGQLLNIEGKRTDQLVLRFHVLSDDFGEGKIPFILLAPLQSSFQNYLTEVAHIINKASKRGKRIKQKTTTSAREWTAISLARTGAGSFKMECESSATSQEIEKLSKACELLEKVSSSNIDDLVALREQIGNEGLVSASVLAQCVANLDLSFSIRWTSPNTPNGYLVIDKRRALKFLDLVNSQNQDLAKARNVTITLTNDEAELVRKEAVGKGGHQSLLRRLQKKLTDDNTLELTPTEIERILRYGLNYGQGGFQGRLAAIAKALKRVGASIQTS